MVRVRVRFRASGSVRVRVNLLGKIEAKLGISLNKEKVAKLNWSQKYQTTPQQCWPCRTYSVVDYAGPLTLEAGTHPMALS